MFSNYVMYTANGSTVSMNMLFKKCVHIIFLDKIFTYMETGVHKQFTYVLCVFARACVYVCVCVCVPRM